jgi:hypothetical protein
LVEAGQSPGHAGRDPVVVEGGGELGLAAVAMRRDHQLPGHGVGHRRSMICPNQVEAEIQTGRAQIFEDQGG